jgi:hypothetical protein
MKMLKSIVALAALLGCLINPSLARAEEAQHAVATALSSTTLSGYVEGGVWLVGSLFPGTLDTNSNPTGTFPGIPYPWYPTNRPTHFVTMLARTNATSDFFAGTGDFLIGCQDLQFNLDIPSSLSNIGSAILFTPSRQVSVNLDRGEVTVVPTNSYWTPFFPSEVVFHYSGSIPLNETLRSELQAGQGWFRVISRSRLWNQPDAILQGNLLGILYPNETNSAACWPRHPRSISARYTQGPIPISPVRFEPLNLDIDRDGQPDYSLSSGSLCTFLFPSICTSFFDISCLTSNELLLNHYSSAILEMGIVIGPQQTTNATWGFSSSANITGIGFGAGDYSYWAGPLGFAGEGYLGVRMPMADGWHYGWIHIRLPGAAEEGFLIIEDWAFEPQPNTPILAGARPFTVPEQFLGIVRPGFLRVLIPTESGRSYIVQRKQSLGALDWENATYFFIATSTAIQIDLPLGETTGFYRVLEAD